MDIQAEHFRLYCAYDPNSLRRRSAWRGARYLVTLIYFAFSIIPDAGQKSKSHIYTAEKWRVSRESDSKCICICSLKSTQ